MVSETGFLRESVDKGEVFSSKKPGFSGWVRKSYNF